MKKKEHKILISKPNGFIGKNLCKILSSNKITFKKFSFKKKYSKKFLSQFTHFIHLQFFISGDKDKNTIYKNYNNIKKVISICIHNNLNLIFTSTCSYKYRKKKKISNKIAVINNYTKSKRMCEELIQKKIKSDTNYAILRLFNVYGSNFNLRGIIPELAKKLKRNKFIEVLHPENSRDFIHVNDVCKLIIKCLRLKKSYIFDVGYGKSMKIKKLAMIMKKKFNYKGKLAMSKIKRSKINNFSLANISYVKKITKWKPLINLNYGLGDFE